MNTHEEDTAVETVPVLTAEEMDGIEEWIGWREEGFKGDVGIEDDCVAVNPAATGFSINFRRTGQEYNIRGLIKAAIYLHNPLSPFFLWFGQLVDHQRQEI